MIAISVGFQRYTYELMLKHNEFVVSFPSAGMSAEVELFGSQSGRDIDKLKISGTPVQTATLIDGVLLAEASINYECILKDSMIT